MMRVTSESSEGVQEDVLDVREVGDVGFSPSEWGLISLHGHIYNIPKERAMLIVVERGTDARMGLDTNIVRLRGRLAK